jgi:acyl carrier protein
MTLAEVKESLRALIAQIQSAPTHTIRDETTLEELQLSSVAFVELQVAIEDAFDLILDPVEVVELNEFGRIASLVHTKTETSRP